MKLGEHWDRLLVVAVALLLTTWNLGGRALWQDEAACAVLGQRLIEHGRPLGYAEGNLITMDTAVAAESATLGERTTDPATAVAYFVERGDFRADTTWVGQPWGSMLVAGSSTKLLGASTWAARLPFALAAVLAAHLLYGLCRRTFDDRGAALLAAALCLGNVYWLLHVRQCRYYSLSSLMTLATFAAYLRWRERGGRWALPFGATAWIWFHCDFGTFWPWMGVLALAALLDPARRRAGLVVFAALGASVLPFALYYRLHDRLKPATLSFTECLGGLAWLLDRYQLPLGVLLAVVVALWVQRRSRPAAELRAVTLAVSGVLAQLVWMAAVSPAAFYRYLVGSTPLACLVLAWGAARVAGDWRGARRVGAFVVAGLVLIVTPWMALPTSSLFRAPHELFDPGSKLVRSELGAAAFDLGGGQPDPNRVVVDFLREHLQEGDEVLVNYEDVPLMFYLDVPVRGGIPCFRVEDSSRAPRWAVVRRAANFVPPGPYQRELARHRWRAHQVNAPDIPFGNNPDPRFHPSRFPPSTPRITILERL